MVTETFLLKRIEILQAELENLKKAVLKKNNGKLITLRGIWKDVDFTDEEIEQAKRSWLKD